MLISLGGYARSERLMQRLLLHRVLKRVENSSEWQKENNFGIYFEPFCA